MSDVAIRTVGLSKRYQLGERRQRYRTLRETLARLGRPSAGSRGDRQVSPPTLWALKVVDLEIKHGDVVGIIGRNGAGKSTLLKLLSRITEPTAGYAEIHGRVGSLLEVGTGFHPELTGRENLYLSGAILGMRRWEIDKKFDEIVEFADIQQFVDTPIKHFSSGMYLRLAFAVAAHLEPEILIVDEVLAVGDLAFQRKCLGKMGDIARTGRTVLFVSHNMAAVQNLCSRAVVLHHGEVLDSGSPDRMIERYTALQDSAMLASTRAPTRPAERFEITEVKFLDEADRPRNTFGEGEPVVAEVVIRCAEQMYDVVLGITLKTAFGSPVCNIRSEDSGILYQLKPGTHVLRTSFRLERFLSNSFSIDLGAIGRGREVLARLPNVAQLTLVAGDLSGHGRTRQAGEVIYVPSRWHAAEAVAPVECE